MDEMLKAGLLPDEKILWRGKAEPFTPLDKTHKKRFIICAGIGLLITALVAAAYFAAVARGGLQAKPYVLLIVLLLCGIPAFNMLGDASKLKKMEYVVTDQRLIVLRDSLRPMPFKTIQEAGFRTDDDGHVSLLCGKDALKAKPDKWREICVVGQSAADGSDVCSRFVFYAPADLKGLKAALKDRLPII